MVLLVWCTGSLLTTYTEQNSCSRAFLGKGWPFEFELLRQSWPCQDSGKGGERVCCKSQLVKFHQFPRRYELGALVCDLCQTLSWLLRRVNKLTVVKPSGVCDSKHLTANKNTPQFVC